MADFNKYYPHLSSSEGGYSADPKDKSAAAYPSKYKMTTGQWKGYPVHTNKGITFRTFTANAKKVGLQPTTEAFINLTYEQAKRFYKLLFWDAIRGDEIKRQGVAEILAEAFIGSLVGGKQMVKDLQSFMRTIKIPVKYTGKIDTQTIQAINYTPPVYGDSKYEYWLIGAMTDARLRYLRSLPVFASFGNTWTRRVNSTKERAESYVA